MSPAASRLSGRDAPTSSVAFMTRSAPRGWLVDAALLAPLLLASLALRLVNLGAYSGLFDEGIRTEQLFLMSQGYRPFRDIFAAQGPLLLDTFYPLYVLFNAVVDPALVAARLVPVTYSLVGLAGIYWVGRQVAGRLAGLAAALILACSPLYLEGSRLALAEVPALAPAILAVGCALRYQVEGRTAWLLAGGLLLTLSLLMKPITLAAAPALALAALLRGRRGLRDLLLAGVAGLLLSVVVVLLLGFADVQDQIFNYRKAASSAADWSLRKNAQAISVGLGLEPAALVPLASLGGLVLLVGGWRRTLPVVIWAIGGLALLLAYSPLHGKHIVVLIPGAALLAGAGVARVSQLWSSLARADRRLLAAPIILAAGWYAATLAPLVSQTGQLLLITADTDVDPAFDQYSDAVAALRALTGPDDFIITDQPYLAFLAERKVPPELVDTALSRIRSRNLTGSKAQGIATAYDPQVVLLWGDRLRSLPTFRKWVETNFQVVAIYNRRGDTDRALYLRRDADFDAARVALAGEIEGPQAVFGGDLRLVGARLGRADLSPDGGATLTMVWELIRPTENDYHVLVELRDANGEVLDDQQESLSAGSNGTSAWAPGRWLVQNSFVVAEDAEPGDYDVAVALYNSEARTRVPVDASNGGREVIVGSLTVR